ncbi:hypothetical protein AMTR_s00082p00049670 [Amborella trichopoda]|uniref:Uncharacterized protein n=1 Tax=Amborella trichopoda TaxID=13333 RepID=W1NU27_AMBTC|nr:hypothetical protein AMTR_s00082p00049670 [Amborella trichopoda]
MRSCNNYREGSLSKRAYNYCRKLAERGEGRQDSYGFCREERENESVGNLVEQRRAEGKRKRMEAYRAEERKREEG